MDKLSEMFTHANCLCHTEIVLAAVDRCSSGVDVNVMFKEVQWQSMHC